MWSHDLNAPAAMLPSLLLFAFVMCVAFAVGFAVRHTGICAYAAARQSVLYRRHSRLRAFFLVACWAGAILLPAAWLVPQLVQLSPVYPVTPAVLLGGAIFGLGVLVNGGCAFGTLAYLSGGDTNYLGTIAGAFAGALIASLLGAGMGQITVSPLSEFGLVPVIIFLAFAAIAACAWQRSQVRRRRGHSRLRIPRLSAGMALAVIGIGGGFLYAVAGQWTYMAILSDRAVQLVTPEGTGTGMTALLGVGATFAGAVFAALRSGRFRLRHPRAELTLQKFIGGSAMGFAAAIIPGGNDIMLVYNLPSGAAHGIAAYAAMMAFLWGFLAIKVWFQRRSRP